MHIPHKPPRLLIFLLFLALTFPATASGNESAIAADDSLALVPADVSFYSSLRRNREQYELVVNSQAWESLRSLPLVQMGQFMLQMALQQPDSPYQILQRFFAEEENQPLQELLIDAVSDEVFFYGGSQLPELFDLAMQLNSVNRFAPLFMLMAENSERVQHQAVGRVLIENLDQLVVPDLVIGLKIKDAQQAQAQLARLEAAVAELLQEHPEWRERWQRQTVAGTEYLTLKIDEAVIPWGDLNLENAPYDEEQRKQLEAHLRSLSATISIGVRNNYLIVAVSDSLAPLEKFGQGKTLQDLAEFERYLPFADRRVTGIAYASGEQVAAVDQSRHDLAALRALSQEYLPQANLSDQQKAQIQADVERLLAQAEEYLNEPGAQLGISFLTERGSEAYGFDWSEHKDLDATQPLTLLKHVGGAPLLAIVARVKTSPDDWSDLRELFIGAYSYLEMFVLPELEDEQREMFLKLKADALPLLQRFDQTTAEKMLPALSEGQSGFVLDADLTSRQWVQALPQSAEPLPMLQPAVVFGVTKPQLLIEGMASYRAIVNDALTLAGKYGQEVSFRIPAPERKETENGQLFFYSFPEAAGVDRRLALTAAVGNAVAALTIAPEHAEQLLRPTPLRYDGPLSRADQPLASAVYVDFAGMLDAIRPWINFGVRLSHQSEEDVQLRKNFVTDQPLLTDDDAEIDDPPAVQQTLQQVHQVLRILGVIRSYSSVTYEEDGALVTHSELRVVDLE